MSKPLEIDFDFTHDDEKLWKLNIPSEEMLLDELLSNLDIAYLEKEGTDDWNLTPNELVHLPERNPAHYEKIQKAHMKYPIQIYFFQGSWKILDGVHRFCKAILQGKKTMRVCKVLPEMIPLILKEDQ